MNSFLGNFYRHLAIFFWSHCTNSLLNCPQVVGHGPRSDLIITPLDLQYFGRYTCKAVNPHGEAFFEIDLKEAREPSFVQQVRLFEANFILIKTNEGWKFFVDTSVHLTPSFYLCLLSSWFMQLYLGNICITDSKLEKCR